MQSEDWRGMLRAGELVARLPYRIKLGENRAELIAHGVIGSRIVKQPLMRRGRRVILLVHPRTVPALLGELERWLEEINEQSRGGI